ncbi:MAG TPA: hypothetical protein VK480_06360 [Solirubrobacterales bacterium]|nr:hypothetical protein [Solirubrobacterales bacterium]
MAVMARETWTDERLDDLVARMDRGFDRVDADIRELRSEMIQGFERVDKGFERVDKRFELIDRKFEAIESKIDGVDAKFDGKFDALQRTMIIGFVTLFASIVGSVIAAMLAVG